MLNGLRTIAHLFNQKIGFSRLGVALSVTIIVIAAFVLYHILRDMDLDASSTRWRRPTGGRWSLPGFLLRPAT
jgi:hypothetical protein